MSRPTRFARRRFQLVAFASAGALVAGVAAVTIAAPAGAAPGAVPGLNAFLGGQGLGDADTRTGTVAPTATQRSIASGLGATVRWNRFGTPQSLTRYHGYLATGLSATPATAARSFLASKAGLFRLSAAQVAALQLINDSKMAQSAGHAVVFRQKIGSLAAAEGGLVTVGVTAGKVAYVSSALAPAAGSASGASLSATQAWVKAATNVGRPIGAISNVRTENGWTAFQVAGFVQTQRARLVAVPLYTGGSRAAYEVNVVDVQGGAAFAYTSFVDSHSGNILVRRNQVDSATETDTFAGAVTATACGPLHPFTVDADTKTIVVAAQEAITTNDIILKLFKGGVLVASSDTATSPEAITYTVPTGQSGVYNVQVCPFTPPMVPFVAPGNYVGVFVASDQAAPTGGIPYPPKWKYFLANPKLNYTASGQDIRKVGCWVTKVGSATVPGCDNPPSPLNNLAARGPWDYNFRTNTPTFTTEGNAAMTAEAWVSPLTPGGLHQQPMSPNRHYGFDNPMQDFQDKWNNSKCNPANLTPGGNDILASVTSLFSSHNRLHDWSYFLGFTEQNYNLQDNNFGNQASGMLPTGGELDPEVGNVQAGAISGGAPTYRGRDNANQITLQDGIPGITNQYLFQPIAGAFYAPCTDGDYDMTVVGHEYNHAISNRMVGGPDAGITSFQGGSMGESWGDQVALEFLFEHSYSTGVNGLVEGPYVTGNKVTGIRNYALDNNPLQYGDLGYDLTGPEVHADGEPWSAVMIDVRKALINKYNADFPVGNQARQRRCAQGNQNSAAPAPPLAAQFCPGNRRWIQMLIDAYLLQPSATSMLDARDAMLAADQMRFGGANFTTMFNAYAKRGFGQFASTAGGEDDDPTPDYTSPGANEGRLQFTATDMTKPGQPAVKGKLYVGRYEARTTPILDTDPATPLGNQAFFVPGTYEFVFQANGFGMRRFAVTIGAGQIVQRELHLSPNLASKFNGAMVTGASPGSVNTSKLIDDTEASNYAATGQAAGVNNTKPFVAVKLAGTGAQAVRSVNVSALLRPQDPGQEENPNMPDKDSGSRFTALRQFRLDFCTQSTTNTCTAAAPVGTAGWGRSYTPSTTAFDSTLPRPLAPDLLLKTFDVPDTTATHVRLVTLDNQCTGTPEYQGEQDNDPSNATDCDTASSRGQSVRASELQAFSYDAITRPPGDPVVLTGMTAPATATADSTITYNITYNNLGPKASALAKVTDALPAGLSFVSATNGGTYSSASRTVTWSLGTVPVSGTGTLGLTARIGGTVPPLTLILNQASFTGVDTIGLPAAAGTAVVP